MKWPLENIEGMDNINHITSAITNGNCASVSDGPFFSEPHQAASAWVLGNEATHRQMKGKVQCAGDKETHSAYRGELAGIFGGLQCIKAICKLKNIYTKEDSS